MDSSCLGNKTEVGLQRRGTTRGDVGVQVLDQEKQQRREQRISVIRLHVEVAIMR